jgi:hypothetical protein
MVSGDLRGRSGSSADSDIFMHCISDIFGGDNRELLVDIKADTNTLLLVGGFVTFICDEIGRV